MPKESFYITTAIDYPNAAPHIGHAYEKLITDTYARWYRLIGRETYFLTGTDENGQKLLKAAQEAQLDTLSFVDEKVEQFRSLCKEMDISNDDFIRTTEERHKMVVHELWKILEQSSQIYFGDYEGMYCLQCESFYTSMQAPDGKCPHHLSELETVKEEGYFFKLSQHADWIRTYIESNPSFIYPEHARKEVLHRINKEPIRDLSISRKNSEWGIPVPGKPDYVIYTWFDALINYVSAVKTKELFSRFWPADVHVIGKDIVWFHCVIWPCMLKAANWPLPKQIYVHGMVLGSDGRKMSKSLGNAADPKDLFQKYPIESFRYYLLRAIPSGLDGAFVEKDLVARHNSELANDYGNLLMRVVKLAKKKIGDELPFRQFRQDIKLDSMVESLKKLMDNREHHRALELIWSQIAEVNLYVTRKEPWKLKSEEAEFECVIYNSLHALHVLSVCLGAFLPKASHEVLASLGCATHTPETALKFGSTTYQLNPPPLLFPKIEI